MDELKKRKNDNGVRKYVNPGWAAVIILILGYVVMFVSNTKAIPLLTKTVHINELAINTLKANYKSIKEDLKEIKDLIKER
ncbi:MAG TPA: hypothetical protein ENH82_05280 [bacterium]|nr:hypothetical protein [bacterium]